MSCEAILKDGTNPAAGSPAASALPSRDPWRRGCPTSETRRSNKLEAAGRDRASSSLVKSGRLAPASTALGICKSGKIPGEAHSASAHLGNRRASLEDFAHLVLRPAKPDPLVGLDQRALDQDRVFRHRLENGGVADRSGDKVEVAGELLLRPQPLARRDPRPIVEPAQLG